MFKVGQEVVCVDDTWQLPWRIFAMPVKGQTYRVQLSPCDPLGMNNLYAAYYIRLEGFGTFEFAHNHFRPLVTKETDISFANEILSSTKQEIDA